MSGGVQHWKSCNYSEFTLSPRASRICAFSGWSEGSSCLKYDNQYIYLYLYHKYVPFVTMFGCFLALVVDNASFIIFNERKNRVGIKNKYNERKKHTKIYRCTKLNFYIFIRLRQVGKCTIFFTNQLLKQFPVVERYIGQTEKGEETESFGHATSEDRNTHTRLPERKHSWCSACSDHNTASVLITVSFHVPTEVETLSISSIKISITWFLFTCIYIHIEVYISCLAFI